MNNGRSARGIVAWGVADQAVSSLSNLALALLVARSVSPAAFGAFGLVFAGYLFALGGARALFSEPLAVRASAADVARWRCDVGRVFALTLVFGFAMGSAGLLIAAAAGGVLGTTAAVVSVFMPALLVQDMWRAAFFVQRAGLHAFINDLVWAVSQCMALLAAFVLGQTTIGWITGAWCLGAVVAGIFGYFQSGIAPDFSAARSWLRSHSDLSWRYFGEFLARNAANTGLIYVTAAICGLAAAGGIRAAQVLLGPVNVVFMGANTALVPEAVRRAAAGGRGLTRLLVWFSVGCALVAAIVGLSAAATPAALGHALLGSNWKPAISVIGPMAFATAALGLGLGAVAGLRAHAAASASFRLRVLTSGVSLGAVATGAAVGGARGAAFGLGIALTATNALWWWAYLKQPRTLTTPLQSPSHDVSRPVGGDVVLR